MHLCTRTWTCCDERQKISREQQFFRRKCLADWRRIIRLLQAAGKVMLLTCVLVTFLWVYVYSTSRCWWYRVVLGAQRKNKPSCHVDNTSSWVCLFSSLPQLHMSLTQETSCPIKSHFQKGSSSSHPGCHSSMSYTGLVLRGLISAAKFSGNVKHEKNGK